MLEKKNHICLFVYLMFDRIYRTKNLLNYLSISDYSLNKSKSLSDTSLITDNHQQKSLYSPYDSSNLVVDRRDEQHHQQPLIQINHTATKSAINDDVLSNYPIVSDWTIKSLLYYWPFIIYTYVIM